MGHLSVPAVLVALALSTASASGHEFWIDPHDYTLAPNEKITADIRVGQGFNGNAYGFIPRNFRRFDLVLGDRVEPVAGRLGDRPALDQAPLGEGLNVIVHVTTDTRLVYDSWELFTGFAEHKDFPQVIERHLARGLGKDDVTETYSRYAKSLVAVGDGAGADRRMGLTTEFVALSNPYTDDVAGQGMRVQVFYDDAPRADTQVEVFAKDAEGAVEVDTVRTDVQGIATVPVSPGVTYMLDAVVMREAGPDLQATMGSAWESLWANLTFAVPAK